MSGSTDGSLGASTGPGGFPVPPPTLTFTEIPTNWNLPGTYIEVRPNYSDTGLFEYPARLLVMGQMAAGAPAAPNTAINVTTALQAASLFGAGSHAAQMAAAALANNPTGFIDVVGLSAPNGAVAATAPLALTGQATGSGVFPLYVDGQYVQVIVAQGDTAATVAANAVAAVGAVPPTPDLTLPVTAVAAAGTVTFTARDLGAVGNGIDVRVGYNPGDVVPPGLGYTVAPLSGGAGSPNITAAIAAIGGAWYTDIACGFSDAANIAVLKTELERRFGAMVHLDARATVASSGTPGTLEAWTPGINEKLIIPVGILNPLARPARMGAALSALMMSYLTEDPARQLRGLVLAGIPAPAPADRFADVDRNALIGAGCSTFTCTKDGAVVLERVVTSYTTNALGVPDPAWRDVMTQAVVSRVRWDWSTYLTLVYPRNKLADDGSLAAEYDDAVVTPGRLTGAWAARCRLYAKQGWIERLDQTLPASAFVRDPNNRNRVNARLVICVLGNFMVFAGALQFKV